MPAFRARAGRGKGVQVKDLARHCNLRQVRSVLSFFRSRFLGDFISEKSEESISLRRGHFSMQKNSSFVSGTEIE